MAMRTLTVPPSQDEVAQAADEISGGALARVRVESWPRGRSHHAYLLTTPGGEQFLFKVHRRPHPGRMRRFLHLAELLQEKHVPHPAVRWYDVEKRTLDVPYYIQDFISGEDAARSLSALSFTDQHRVGEELGAGLRVMHRVEDDASRRRAEIYEIYLLLAGIVWYRSNELPERERFCRERLVGWLAQHA